MATSQQYSLRWNNYLRHITYAFDNLRSQDDFVDVTLCCDGRKIKAHKVLLSACSGYFKEIFKENPCPHPVIIFKFIKYEDLLAIIEFMYQGEVNVQQEALQSFLQTAEILAVQGLTSEDKEKPKTQKTQIGTQIIEERIVKTVPTTIRAVTESNTQTPAIEIQANIIQSTGSVPIQGTTTNKKRKITFAGENEVYTETVTFTKEEPTIVKTSEVQYIPTTMKMDIPEYIDVSEANQLNETQLEQQEQHPPQDTTTQTTGTFTSEYEILTEQTNYESEIEEKYQRNDDTDNNDISTDEIGIFSSNTVKSSSNEKLNSSQGSRSDQIIVDSMEGGKTGESDVLVTVNEESWKCDVCNRQLQSASALKRHKASRHDERTSAHICKMCKKCFKTKWSLSTHNSRFHRDTRSAKESIKMDFSF